MHHETRGVITGDAGKETKEDGNNVTKGKVNVIETP